MPLVLSDGLRNWCSCALDGRKTRSLPFRPSLCQTTAYGRPLASRRTLILDYPPSRHVCRPLAASGREGSTSIKKTKQTPETVKSATPVTLKPNKQPGQKKGKWAVLDWSEYNRPWQVNWGVQRTALGMLGWALSFLLVGVLFLPLLIYLRENQHVDTLSKSNQSLLVLLSQGVETVIGVTIINVAATKWVEPSEGVLKLDFREPLKPPTGWLFWAGLGVVAAPAVVGATAAACEALTPQGLGGRGTADDVARILTLELPSYASLLTVTAIMAPFLEETVFRGFLLPSLTKYMPTYAAVLVSALAFAGCHLSPRDFPQLTALGVLLGFSYVRSRNLLTPMVIHGAWNGTVLTFLFALVAAGFDVQQVLAGK